jgi:hypothetical protein
MGGKYNLIMKHTRNILFSPKTLHFRLKTMINFESTSMIISLELYNENDPHRFNSLHDITCYSVITSLHVGSEVCTDVTKSPIFCDITPIYTLKINQLEVDSLLSALWCWFLAWLILRPWRWRQQIPLKRLLIFNWLYGVIPQKTELLTSLLAWILQ